MDITYLSRSLSNKKKKIPLEIKILNKNKEILSMEIKVS